MNTKNIVYTLDSYKFLHGDMMPEGTEYVYSYFEARKGAQYDYTIFFGLQYIIKEWLQGSVLTKQLIDDAEPLLKEHFKFNGDVWNRDKWDYIVEKHEGKLPVVIKAVKEGSKIPINNVLFTIENTDPKCYWLTNALETLIQQSWYGTTVATRSHLIVNCIKHHFRNTVDDNKQWLADYYLHDFAARGVSCMEQVGIGGMAHLINSKGTDSFMSIPFAMKYYGAKNDGLAYSVPASEHSVNTALGKEGEFEVVKNLIKKYPTGILSVVSDSYSIENAIKVYCTDLKQDILGRNGKFVIRPDSPRFEGDTPDQQILWIAEELWKGFGGTRNSKGYRVLHEKIGIIYGDSLTEQQIRNSLELLKLYGFSAETCVYGCGSYLLMKLNRDTMRFAVKSSAQCRNGVWYDIYKEPKDISKKSKRGKLKLVKENEMYVTKNLNEFGEDALEIVFENGELKRDQTFQQIRDICH